MRMEHSNLVRLIGNSKPGSPVYMFFCIHTLHYSLIGVLKIAQLVFCYKIKFLHIESAQLSSNVFTHWHQGTQNSKHNEKH